MGLFDTIRKLLGEEAQPTRPAQATETYVAPTEAPAADAPNFPYPLVAVHGRDALSTWTRLRTEDGGYPVVLGTQEDVDLIREGIEDIDDRSPEEVLAAATDLTFPASLAAKRDADAAKAREWFREQGHDEDEDETYLPPVGDWPDEVTPNGFGVAYDILTSRPHQRVYLAILPCANGWEAMAHLRWGNWNENPAPEYHVAALRDWHQRFGAELVSCSHDVIELRVARRPLTRDAALGLAREQYLYCNDIVDQGTETFAGLAATLMKSDWWYFWWD